MARGWSCLHSYEYSSLTPHHHHLRPITSTPPLQAGKDATKLDELHGQMLLDKLHPLWQRVCGCNKQLLQDHKRTEKICGEWVKRQEAETSFRRKIVKGTFLLLWNKVKLFQRISLSLRTITEQINYAVKYIQKSLADTTIIVPFFSPAM